MPGALRRIVVEPDARDTRTAARLAAWAEKNGVEVEVAAGSPDLVVIQGIAMPKTCSSWMGSPSCDSHKPSPRSATRT